MAWTARKGEDLKEFLEDDKVLEQHCKELAALIKGAKHLVCYTGAGISCSAGIPDFRGPQGVWTLAAQGKKAEAKVSTLQAIPTAAHMALVKLQNEGVLKHLISSNCDGLHVRSGIEPKNITEVHGNSNREECSKCNRSYYRDFGTRCRDVSIVGRQLQGREKAHATGRFCVCSGLLCDSIINFGENLSEKAIEDGFYHGEHADVMVAMGASLTVKPSCNMVEATKKKGGKLVIINLQKTPYDDICDLRIFAKTDDVWKRVMKHLDLEIPDFELTRRLALFEEGESVRAIGLAKDGTPSSWVKNIASVNGAEVLKKYSPKDPILQDFHLSKKDSSLVLFSYGFYNECPVQLEAKALEQLPCFVRLTYCPVDGSWKQEVEKDDALEKLVPLCELINSKAAASVSPVKKEAAVVDEEDEVTEQGFFAVTPKTDCPHLAELATRKLEIDTRAPCVECGDCKENWICLGCSSVRCSRYRNKHMVEHIEKEGSECYNKIVASFSDFSFWCPSCESYITHPALNLVKKAMELSKFGEDSK